MSAGLWVNNDGLPLFFGTAKPVSDEGGDYVSYGANRLLEVRINLANLITANATVISENAFFPAMANMYIEKVELTAEVGMSTGSSPTLSLGVSSLTGGSSTVTVGTYTTYTSNGVVSYKYNGGTAATTAGTAVATAKIPTNGGTAFVSALAASSLSTAGDLVTLTTGSTSAGNYIGDFQDTTNLTSPLYLTGTLGTHTATGIIVARIYYHGVGTITQ